MLIIIRLDHKLSYVTWKFIDISSVLGLLHRLDVSDVADVSEVHASSIFMVEVSVTDVYYCVYSFLALNFIPS